MNINSEYISISEYYLVESQRIVSTFVHRHKKCPAVLKTDLWNEDKSEPVEGGIIFNLVGADSVYGIEYNPDRMSKVRDMILGRKTFARSISVLSGDIRNLPYEDKKFDVLIDLSTIDHILPADMPETIKGYARVISEGGYMLLISWCDKNFKDEVIVNYSSTTQYYHSLERLQEEIMKYFIINEVKQIYSQDGKDLVQIYATRKSHETLEV